MVNEPTYSPSTPFADFLEPYGLVEPAHMAHDLVLLGYTLLYLLAFISGVQTLFVLRHRANFSLKKVLSIIWLYVLNLFTTKEFTRPADQKAWGVAWVAVCFSSIACFVFFIKSGQYFLDGGSRILGLTWSIPWAIAHFCSSLAALLFHVVTNTAAKNRPELLDE